MAIIKLGALVAGIRGTIGGVTYSANLAGPNARLWSRGANPRTTKQSTQRGYKSQCPALWRALTPTEKDDWNDWAALPAQVKVNSLGEDYYVSGWVWFTTINMRLIRAGLTPRTDPPSNSVPAAPTIEGVTFEESGGNPLLELDLDSTDFPGGIRALIFGAAVPGGGRTVNYRGRRLMYNDEPPDPDALDLTVDYVGIWGEPLENSQLFLEVFLEDDQGMRSTAATETAVYTV